MTAEQDGQHESREKKRRPYEKPTLRSIELPLEETMAEGCKLGGDINCQGNFQPGS